jgi:hypothetical protein
MNIVGRRPRKGLLELTAQQDPAAENHACIRAGPGRRLPEARDQRHVAPRAATFRESHIGQWSKQRAP